MGSISAKSYEINFFCCGSTLESASSTQTIEDAVSMSEMLFDLEVLETAKTHPQSFVQPLPWYQYQTKISSFEPDRRQGWLDLYNNSRSEIESSIDPERLIVFNVKQGWEPLIDFLGY